MNKINKTDICFSSFIKYKTSVLRCSPKKFKSIARQLKGMNFVKAIDTLALSPKAVCYVLYKDFVSIKNNLLNILLIDSTVVQNIVIGFVVTEKNRKRRSTRFKARGRGSAAITYDCTASVYLKSDTIENFTEYLQKIKTLDNTEQEVTTENNHK